MMSKCTLCGNSELKEVLDVGNLPIAHQFASDPHTAKSRQTYPMKLMVCPNCGMSQLEENISPEILYTDYNFCFSAWKRQPHIEDEWQQMALQHEGGRLLEVGANDGLFLHAKPEHLPFECEGIEPNPNACEQARQKGLTVHNKFFSEQTCKDMADGSYDVIIARQVLEHINGVDSFLRLTNRLLSEEGLLCLEVPNTDIALRTGDVTCLWEEHVNYFTSANLRTALNGFGFDVVLEKNYEFSGEAIFVIAKKRNNVSELVLIEAANIELFLGYRNKFEQYRKDLMQRLEPFLQDDAKLVLYGSGCRASTFIHAHEIIDNVSYVVDDQPEKQGLYMAGTQHEVITLDALPKDNNYVFMLAVNKENEHKVKARIEGNGYTGHPIFSILSPNDITLELENLEYVTV